MTILSHMLFLKRSKQQSYETIELFIPTSIIVFYISNSQIRSGVSEAPVAVIRAEICKKEKVVVMKYVNVSSYTSHHSCSFNCSLYVDNHT